MEENIKDNKINKTIALIKKVLFWMCLGICVFLVIVAGWLCIDKFIIGSKVPSFCGFSSLYVETGSMSGTIEEDDIIVIKKSEEYKIGDIITFIHEDEEIPTTHRIISYTSDGKYITKGDANESKDRIEVSEEEILGKVVAHLRGLSLFIGWFTEGGGYIYIVGIVLVVGLGIFFIKEFKEDKNSELEKSNEDCGEVNSNVQENKENLEESKEKNK